ncbi:MAG: type III polyketide synthase [Verrucomicrobia bacterium]|nr:type III polyketide synthase [Verrucomicrobiota bacterium]
MIHAYLNEIGTAVPAGECQQQFLDSLPSWIPDPALVNKLRAIAKRSGIEGRHTVLDQVVGQPGSGAFYEIGNFPGTGRRMEVYRETAPALAVQAVRALEARGVELNFISHLVITSCTGFYAPGLDVDLIRLLGLPRNVCRTLIGFMGCYAGITGLRTANDIVRADPEARVLVVNLELCSLHLQQDAPIDRLVASLLFSDGCAASLVSAESGGFRLDSFTSHLSLEDADKMQWLVEDQGFAMKLDADIPDRIREYLARDTGSFDQAVGDPRALWAIHPGGRAILDAVRSAFSLTSEQIAPARRVLASYGNMSSASIMFVFEELLRHTPQNESRPGAAIAFGPGLTLKAMEFTYVPPVVASNFRDAEAVGEILSPAI